MANINIDSIKDKLYKFGITYDTYLEKTGNLVGKPIVPNALRAYNRELTYEEAFYLVANKVFDTANMLAHSIPIELQQIWYKIAAPQDFKDFQLAIFEEVNQRMLSNTFPEFQNAGTVSVSNMSIQNGFIGGGLTELINKQSQQLIANIDWYKYSEDADNEREKLYMLSDFSNLWIKTATYKRVLIALEDGTSGVLNLGYFAKDDDLKKANDKIDANLTLATDTKTEVNEIKNKIKSFCTKDELEKIATAFAKTEEYDPDKTYMKMDFVAHAGGIYYSNIDDNIGNTPGGVTGVGKWTKANDIFTVANVTDVIYGPATDFKVCNLNPNSVYYVKIQDLLAIESLDANTLFAYLDKNYPHLNLTIEESNRFFNALCNSDVDLLKSTYGPKIKFNKDKIETFDDLQSLYDWVAKNKLLETQYQIIKSKKYIKIGDETSTLKEGGKDKTSFTITENNIKKKDWSFQLVQNWLQQDASMFPLVWNNRNVSITDGSYASGNNIQQTNGDTYTSKGINWSFGVDSPKPIDIQLDPEFYTIYMLKILEDVYEESLPTYTNICKMSLEGKLIKTIDGEEVPNDKDYLYIEKQKKSADELGIYILKSISGEIITTVDAVSLNNYLDTQFAQIREEHTKYKGSDTITVAKSTISLKPEVLDKINSAIQPTELDQVKKELNQAIKAATPTDYDTVKSDVATNKANIASFNKSLANYTSLTSFNSTVANLQAKIDANTNNLNSTNTKVADVVNQLATKQDKLVAGANIQISADGVITATDTGVSAEYVQQQIAAAKIDPVIREQVETQLWQPINKKIQVLEDKDVDLQKQLGTKITLADAQSLVTPIENKVDDINNTIIPSIREDITDAAATANGNQVLLAELLGFGDGSQPVNNWPYDETLPDIIRELRNNHKHIYAAGECKYFKTKALADAWLSDKKIPADAIEITNEGFVIGTGENGAFVQYKLKPQDIPYMTGNGTTKITNGALTVQSKLAYISGSKRLTFLTEMASSGYVTLDATQDSSRTLDWNSDPDQLGSYYTPTDGENTQYTYTLNHSHDFNFTIGYQGSNQSSIKSSYIERYEIVFKREVIA